MLYWKELEEITVLSDNEELGEWRLERRAADDDYIKAKPRRNARSFHTLSAHYGNEEIPTFYRPSKIWEGKGRHS